LDALVRIFGEAIPLYVKKQDRKKECPCCGNAVITSTWRGGSIFEVRYMERQKTSQGNKENYSNINFI